MNPENKKIKLIEGSVPKVLTKLTLPMMLAVMAMIGFNLIDTFFVGKLGTEQLAAISFTFPVIMIITSLMIGIGVGASSVVSRVIGNGNFQKVKDLTMSTLLLSLIIVIVLAGIGLLTIDPVFKLLGADDVILPMIKEYIIVWYLGIGFVVVPMVGNSIIRATGDTKSPSMIMLFAVIINLILDPIFIFGWGIVPAMGLFGAAMATVVARMFTFVLSLWILIFKEKILCFHLPSFKVLKKAWKEVLYIGAPASIVRVLYPVSMGIGTALVAVYGTEAVASLGVAVRVESFVLIPLIALATSLVPFIGQNWGAKKYNRVWEAVRHSFSFALIWGVFMFVILNIFSGSVAGVFDKNIEVISNVVLYIFIASFSYGLLGIFMLSESILNTINKPFHSAGISFLRLFILFIPLAYLGSYLFELKGIFIAISFSSIVGGIISYFVVRKMIKTKVGEVTKPRLQQKH